MTDAATAEARETPFTILRPKSREEWLAGRTATIGASELPALFGAHPYLTPFQLLAIKRGLYKPDFAEVTVEENTVHYPVTERGNALEPIALDMISRARPRCTFSLNQIPGGLVYVDGQSRMSATPDILAIDENERNGTIQIKTMTDRTFKEHWFSEGEGTPVAPIHVAIQAIADATLSGCDWAAAAALVIGYAGDLTLHLVPVPLHAALMTKARVLVREFWVKVADGTDYPPDFSRDGEAISAVYRDDGGAELDFSADEEITKLIAERELLTAIESSGRKANEQRVEIDNALRYALGNATAGRLADGRLVRARVVKRKAFSVAASQSRPVKIVQGDAK